MTKVSDFRCSRAISSTTDKLPRLNVFFFSITKTIALDCSTPFQVVLDVLSVLSIEPLTLLVELHVPLVDVINVIVRVVTTPPAKFVSLSFLSLNICCHFVNCLLCVLVYSMHNSSNSCIESFSSLFLVVGIHLHIRLDLCGQPAVLPEGGVLKGGEALVW